MAGPTSTRFAAWEQVEDALEAIISGSGYWFDPTVTTDHPDPDTALSVPCLVMSMGSELMTESTVGHTYHSIVMINVDGYVNHDDDYIENGCKLSQDVRRAVVAIADQLHGIIAPITMLTLGDMDTETGWLDVEGGLVRFTQPVEIHYKTRTAW